MKFNAIHTSFPSVMAIRNRLKAKTSLEHHKALKLLLVDKVCGYAISHYISRINLVFSARCYAQLLLTPSDAARLHSTLMAGRGFTRV
jgi:hypothetical protein